MQLTTLQGALHDAMQSYVKAPAGAASTSSPSGAGRGSGGASNENSGAGSALGANSTLSTVLNSVLGNRNSAGGTSDNQTSKNGTSKGGNGQVNLGPTNNGKTGAAQGNALAGSDSGASRGGAQPGSGGGAAEPQSTSTGPVRRTGAAFASGALGVGQSGDSLLTVYGCSRMGAQVICDTDLSNQNNNVTQVNSADQWKDVCLQDDAGDNHMRSMGVFENQNGDQRTSITLPYGEKSRYILVFNNVPASVKSVTLVLQGYAGCGRHSVANPDATPDAQGAVPGQGAPAGMQPAVAPAGRNQGASRPPHS